MNLTYDAFVSYSRADKAFVERLVKHLERFAPPKALGLPARRLRVFMDTKDLIGTGYYDAVGRALVSARKLIVVCSPSARKSPYVDDEIRRFLKAQDRTGRDIIPILLDGIPNNEARTPEQEAIKAFPEVFYDHIEMPLAVDYLRFDLRRSKLDDGAYANSWFMLLANILDVNREELEEREAKRRRQRRLTIGAITGAVMVALTTLSIVALWQRDEAVDQRQKAYARQLAAQGQLGLADTIAPPQQALKQAMTSLQLASSKEAIEALKIGVERLPPTHVSRLAMDEKDAMGDLSFSPNGEWVVGASEKDIRVWRASDGARVFRQAVDTQMELRGFTADGRHALYLPRKQGDKQDSASMTPQLLVLEIKGHGDGFELKSHRFERILDAIVAGHGLFALVSNATGKRISVQDLLREETIGTLELQKAVVLGALDAENGESVIVDAAGKVRRLGYGLDTGKAEFKLPAGDRALAIGLIGGASSPPQAPMEMPMMSGGIIGAPRSVLITQRADQGLTIFSLASGQAVRELSPEQASNFSGFVAAGMLLAATGTQTGASLFTLDGQLVTTLVHSRAKDWDLSQMGVTGRQDPIIDVGVSDDGQMLVTARKDGRVSVWRSSVSPRYGTWGALPMPDMENVAHFDHGNELGETVTWSGPPVLSVSPDGRYVASQSMGLEPNPAGGIKRLNPLLRIWDTRQRKEIGRFYPLGGMAVKFAPRGNLLLTASVPRELLLDRSKSDTEKKISLDVWRLSPYLFEKLRRSEVTRRSTPPLYVRADPAFSNTTGVAVSPTGQRAVWVGSDLRLRAWDAASPDVAVVEDLVPVIEHIFAAQSELFSKRANEHKKLDLPQWSDLPPVENLVKNWRAATNEIRADWPIGIPIAISGNGCCALLAIGTTLRLYDLSSKGLIGERIVDDFVSTTGPYGLGIDDILLSDNGRFFLAVGTTQDQHEAMQQHRRGGLSEELATEKIELRTYSATGKNPPMIKSMTLPVLPSPLLPIRAMVPLAIDPTGRRIVVDKIELPSKAGRAIVPSRRLQIIDFQDGKAPLELSTEQWMPIHPMDFGSMLKTRSAAFSEDGRYIAVRLTEPECRSASVVQSMASIPMQIPSCSGVRISYMVRDIQTGQQSADVEDIAESGFNPSLLMMPPSANTESTPATVQSPWTARTDPQQRPEGGNGNTGDSKAQAEAGITTKFTESDPYREWIIAMQRLSRLPKQAIRLYGLLVPTAKLTGFARAGSGFMLDGDNAIVTTQTQGDAGSGSPLLITRRLNSSADSVVEEACARLEPEHRAFSPAQWASQFPGASFHPICAPTGGQR